MTTLVRFGSRRWTGIAAGALVVVLAACGSQAKTVEVKKKVAPSPRKAVLASVRATTAAKSARISMRMSADGPAGDMLAVTADGVTDFTTGDGVLKMELAGPRAQGRATNLEVRKVGDAIYMKMPVSFGRMAGNGKWLKMPGIGAADGLVPGLGQSDPSQFLAYLETVSSGVKKVGTESIRGVETTHYAATLDLAEAIDRAHVPASLRDDLSQIVQKVGASFTMPADVWVDGDGLTRRIQLKFDLGQMAGAPTKDVPVMTISIDLYDFGVPVHVEAPTADQVTEFPFGASGPSGAAT